MCHTLWHCAPHAEHLFLPRASTYRHGATLRKIPEKIGHRTSFEEIYRETMRTRASTQAARLNLMQQPTLDQISIRVDPWDAGEALDDFETLRSEIGDQVEGMEELGITLVKSLIAAKEAEAGGSTADVQAAQDALDTFIAAYLAMRGAVADANAHEHALAHIPGPEHGRVGLEAAYDHEYAARRAKEMKASVKDTNDFENFLYVVGNPHCRQGELPHPTEAQSDEDDDIMVDRNPLMPLNRMCPLKQVHILSLSEPVEDVIGYIYERANIVQYITDMGGSAESPVAGCKHKVTIQQLVPSKRVKRLRMCKEQGIHMLAEEERDEITEIS